MRFGNRHISAWIWLCLLGLWAGRAMAQDSLRTHGDKVPCDFYEVGKFEYVDDNFHNIVVKRTRRRQVEKNLYTGQKWVYKLEWVSDCEYHLTFKRSNQKSRYRKGWVVEVKMIAVYEDWYDFDADRNGIIQYGTARRRLSKAEIKAKQREEQERIAREKEDSTRLANGLPTLQQEADSIALADSLAEAEKLAAKEARRAEKEKDDEVDEGGEAKKSAGDRGDEGDKPKKKKREKKKKEKKRKEKKKREKKKKPKKEKRKKKDEEEDDPPDSEIP